MNIIFLDIDGVLNNKDTFIVQEEHFLKTGESLVEIEPIMISRLAKIVKETDSQIVLSSSWRYGWDPEYEKCSSHCKKLINSLDEYGLICEISELDNTATPISNFTTFVTQTCNAWTYRHGSCHGAVIIKTTGEPEIHNQKLDPYQIVGFVSSDKSGLHDFVTREEMQAMEPEFDPEKYYEQFKDSTLQKESINPVEQMIDEAKHELETEGLNTEDKEISFPMKDFDLAI